MHTVDKTGWADGPWLTEPDKVQWYDEATGMACLIVRSGFTGCLCGYVGVEPDHPVYEVDYGDVEEVMGIRVHGGLTYASKCVGHICHMPDPGRSDDLWWLGFDCGHAWDVAPGMRARDAIRGWKAIEADQTYRDLSYVRAECTRLAAQLATYTHG